MINLRFIRTNPEKVEELLSSPKLAEYRDAGLINEIALRNLLITREYIQLRKEIDHFDAIYKLARKYTLSEESIQSILHREQKRKPVKISLNG